MIKKKDKQKQEFKRKGLMQRVFFKVQAQLSPTTDSTCNESVIGLKTCPQFRNKGFKTEIAGGIIEWANTQAKVISVIAFLQKVTVASFKVLEKIAVLKPESQKHCYAGD